jgi:hypothetical protein
VTLPRLRATLLGVIGAAAAIVAAACGSSNSSGPNITIGDIARHYDQLAGAYLAGAGTDPNIGRTIEVFNGAVAAGVSPGSAQVSGGPLTKAWLGNVVDLVDSAATDSVQVVSFWFSGNINAVLQLIYHKGQFDTAFVTDSGGNTLQDSVAAVTGAFTAATGTCTFTTITNISTQYPSFDPSGSTCTLVGVDVRADSILFPKSDQSTTSLFNRLLLPSQHLTGVRLQFDHEATFNAHVVQPLAKALQRR